MDECNLIVTGLRLNMQARSDSTNYIQVVLRTILRKEQPDLSMIIISDTFYGSQSLRRGYVICDVAHLLHRSPTELDHKVELAESDMDSVNMIREQSATYSILQNERLMNNPSALFPRTELRQLPPLALDFLSSIPRGDYPRSLEFVTQHQESLNEPSLSSLYENEAAQSLVRADKERAANCIEKAILIEITCCYKKSSDRLAYFEAMHAREPKVYDDFKSLFRQKYNQSKSKADQLAADRIHHERSGSVDDSCSSTRAAYPVRGSRQGSQPVATSQYRVQDQEQRHRGTSSPEERADRVERTVDRPIRGEVDLNKFELLTHIEEPQAPESALLDEKYYKRTPKEARMLFRVGRVVSILTHHDYNGDPIGFKATADLWLNAGPKGSFILSSLQRYAVVKEGHGFCWAVPITTYGGQGTTKRGLSLNEIEAHAIAYSTRKPSAELEKERRLPKRPIAIDCYEGHQLHPASRINFAKVRTIEHNVRVMDIGRVASSSMGHFDQYSNEEMHKMWGK